ncbi:MAG: hypothetical protein EOM87_07445 [Clostridia bacterium]|nr:hypothetical protein [Clostridia bacterium]
MAYYEDMNKYLDLEQGLLCNCFVELINNKYCIINGHRGISEFSVDCVRVRARKGYVCVLGQELRILALTPTEVYVSGIIKGIQLDE